MSEVTVNPGKQNGVIGFVVALVSLLLGGWIMATLFAISFSTIVAALVLILPIVAIVMSVKGMKASKAAGQKNGLAVAGLVIGIVAAVYLLLGVMAIGALSTIGNGALNELQNFDQGDFDKAMEGFEGLKDLAE